MQQLNLGEQLRKAAHVLKENFSIFFVLSFLGNILFIGNAVFVPVLRRTIYDGILFLLANIVFIWSVMAIIYATSKIFKGEKVTLPEAFQQRPGTLVRFFFSCILYLFLTFIGILLFVIPGVYLGTVFSLSYLPVILENKGIIEGFTISRNLIKGYFWPMLLLGTVLVFCFVFFCILVEFAGVFKIALTGLIGIFYVAYVTILEFFVYNRLKEIKAQETT